MLRLMLIHIDKKAPAGGIYTLRDWNETVYLIEAEWRTYASVNLPSLVQIMACRLVGAKPLSEAVLVYCWLDP